MLQPTAIDFRALAEAQTNDQELQSLKTSSSTPLKFAVVPHLFPPASLVTFANPDARFSQVHIDIVEPLPHSRRHSYLLMCINCFTRWPEAFPMQDITAEAVALTFASGWVATFGVPSSVTTD